VGVNAAKSRTSRLRWLHWACTTLSARSCGRGVAKWSTRRIRCSVSVWCGLPDRGTLLAATALGSNATVVFLHEQTIYLITPDDRIEPFEADVAAAPTA
jgi:hypothetical protein